jgi:hypothetical protein
MIESAGANNQKKMRSSSSPQSAISLFFDYVLRAARVRNSHTLAAESHFLRSSDDNKTTRQQDETMISNSQLNLLKISTNSKK